MAVATKPRTGVVVLLAVLGACVFSAMVFTGSANAARWECERQSGNHCTALDFGYGGYSSIRANTYRKVWGVPMAFPGVTVHRLCVGARKPNGEERTIKGRACEHGTNQHSGELWPDPHSRPYAYWWDQHAGSGKLWVGAYAS